MLSMNKIPINLSLAMMQVFCQIVMPLAAAADPMPSDLIPPDVTLSPNARSAKTPSQTSTASSTPGTSAPGLSNTQLPYAKGRGVYGGASTNGNNPPPPPMGSSAFTGFKTPPPNQDPGASQNQNQNQSQSQATDPVAVIETERGTITMRLFQKYAPRTVEAFIEMVKAGFYNGLTFHRVEPGFVVQGGCPNGNGSGFFIDPKTNHPRLLLLEPSAYLKHNAAGVVAMAHTAKNPHSSSCQFYITLGPQPNLDGRYSIFGGVISGMDVVQQIQKGDKIQSITMEQ